MFTNHKRILMSEADAGGASIVAPAETTTESAAQTPAAPVQAVDVDALVNKVHDKLFAELRRSGVFEKKSKAAPAESTQTQPAAPAPDLIRLRAMDRALNKIGLATELSQSQYDRAERAFTQEAPDDVDGWVRDYFQGFRGSQPTQPVPAPQAPVAARPAPVSERPVSDRGSVAAAAPLVDADLVTMSDSDRAALIKEKGIAWYRTRLASQLKGRQVTFR